MKLCKNCHWFFWYEGKASAQCMWGKDIKSKDPVFGNIKWRNTGNYTTCLSCRQDYNMCGASAKWFKEKR